MDFTIRIGTRESELAVWQANHVSALLANEGYSSTLVYIKSEGDIDLKTPLYEMGVQGIFTRSLDIALLNNRIDIAVHSMKDVPTTLPKGIVQAAVLKRGNFKDLFVPNINHIKTGDRNVEETVAGRGFTQSLLALQNNVALNNEILIATSSIRRKAQWLYRYPNSIVENLRGNVNTRLKKVSESNWAGAIFAAAGLERINLRPEDAVELDWMLPAPAQGAIMIACKENDNAALDAARKLNDDAAAMCTQIEKDFLKELLGGCSTPVGALAQVHNNECYFEGNIFSVDGKQKAVITKEFKKENVHDYGKLFARELLQNGGQIIADSIQHAG